MYKSGQTRVYSLKETALLEINLFNLFTIQTMEHKIKNIDMYRFVRYHFWILTKVTVCAVSNFISFRISVIISDRFLCHHVSPPHHHLVGVSDFNRKDGDEV